MRRLISFSVFLLLVILALCAKSMATSEAVSDNRTPVGASGL